MKMKPSITMHYGAAHNDITVDAKTFELNRLSAKDHGFIRRVVVGGLDTVGYFKVAK
jgi:hypothetical protein